MAMQISYSPLFIAEFEQATNEKTNRPFWRYRCLRKRGRGTVFSGAAGDLVEALDTTDAFIQFLARAAPLRRPKRTKTERVLDGLASAESEQLHGDNSW